MKAYFDAWPWWLATLRTALVSRALWLLYCVCVDWAFADHAAKGVTEFELASSLSFSLSTFTKWDSAHFLNLAARGYKHEMEAVFFPLYPTIVGKLAKYTQELISHRVLFANTLVATSLLVNGIYYCLSCLLLWLLLEKWRVSLKWRKKCVVAVYIIFNPMAAFATTCYSESQYSFFAWLGMYLLEVSNPWGGCGAIIAFFMASWTRSNGILNTIFGISTFLKGYRRRSVRLLAVGAGVCLASALPLVLNDLANFRCFCAPASAGGSMIYAEICGSLRECSDMPDRPLWAPLMSEYVAHVTANGGLYYSHLQKKFWNVGLLSSFTLKQLPNIMLATPIVLIAGNTLSSCTSSKLRGAPWWHLLANLLLGLTVAHVQITTRLLLAACPLMYFGIVDLIIAQEEKSTRPWVLVFVVLFSVGGAALHCNFFPWT